MAILGIVFSAYVVACCWVAFLAYWAIAATRVKKDASRHTSLWLSIGGRLILGLIVGLSLAQPAVRRLQEASVHFLGLTTSTIGAALCVAGIAFAVWARVHLGSNWSDQPSTKRGHELVTSGPYRIVRHPIYSGLVLALLGTAMATGFAGLLAFVCATPIFVYRMRVEEQLLTRLFPDEYPNYQRRTKALIPCVM